MHTRVLEAEQILSGDALRADKLSVTNASVGQRFDAWCRSLQAQLQDGALIGPERECLEHFVHVTQNMRPHLIECPSLRRVFYYRQGGWFGGRSGAPQPPTIGEVWRGLRPLYTSPMG